MLSYQHSPAFEDFYDSIQAIPGEFDANEGFGKEIRPQPHRSKPNKNFKKILSVENFHGLQSSEGFIKKSSSTATFEDNENEFQPYRKSHLHYVHEDQSTMSSLSPFNSVGSLSSMVSMNGANQNPSHKPSKTKFNQGKKKAYPSETDFRVKYKTEVCKYWANHGFCNFGDQCAFAHGKAEIRQKQHISTNYKTKKCVQFHENGVCLYGIRCQFVHCGITDNVINGSEIGQSYARDLEVADIWCSEDPDCVCMRRKTRGRLPCLVRMSNEHIHCEGH